MTLRGLATISLLALASVVFLGKAYETGLRGIDSNIHAAVSMSVTSGPTLAPRLPIPMRNFAAASVRLAGSPIDPNATFNDHPFFIFWLNGLVMRALGPTAASARLLTGLFSVGSVALTIAIGTRLATPAFGMLAGLFLVFCRDFVLTSATVSLDTALVFFILLTHYLWIATLRARAMPAFDKRWVALGVAAGIGLWVKTPLVLLAFPVAVVHDLAQRDLRGRPVLAKTWARLAGAGAIAVAVGSLVWIYTGLAGGWDLVHDYWVRQLWGTAVGGRGPQAQGWDWGRFFLYNLRTGFLPGLPFLLVALVRLGSRALREGRNVWLQDSVLIPGTAVLIVGLTVTALKFKMGHYFTPIFPFLALLAAHSFGAGLSSPRGEQRLYGAITAATPLLLAGLLIFPVSFGPEAFVALRRFVPYIQTQGDCSDVIALVPGGEPAGSDLDYTLYLSFYTGRKLRTIACPELTAAALAAERPRWLILAEDNLKCLSTEARARYPSSRLVGTQYLLSTESAAPTDLTPLELPYEAVTDCRAPRYPQDLWHRYLAR